MHVLWINERADFAGGAERYVAETAALLGERGVRNTLLYGVGGWMDPGFTSRFDGAFPLVEARRQIAELAPDVVYLHQVADPGVVDAAARSGVRSLRFFHDHELFCLREHKYTTVGHRTCTRKVGVGCYACLGFASRGADRSLRLQTVDELRERQRRHRGLSGIVVGSRYMREHVLAHGFDGRRVHVCPLYVRPAARLADVERDPDELLFVGGLLRGKGIDLLVDALAALPARTRLRVVGEGPQRDLLERRAARAGVRGRIELAGRLEGEALERAYRRAACLVMPSRAPETFGLTGPEALVHGTPVVAASVGGVGEWLEDGVTGLSVPPGDARALAGAIARLLDDPERARRLGESGRALCERRLTPERHVRALLEVLDGPGGRREAA